MPQMDWMKTNCADREMEKIEEEAEEGEDCINGVVGLIIKYSKLFEFYCCFVSQPHQSPIHQVFKNLWNPTDISDLRKLSCVFHHFKWSKKFSGLSRCFSSFAPSPSHSLSPSRWSRWCHITCSLHFCTNFGWFIVLGLLASLFPVMQWDIFQDLREPSAPVSLSPGIWTGSHLPTWKSEKGGSRWTRWKHIWKLIS